MGERRQDGDLVSVGHFVGPRIQPALLQDQAAGALPGGRGRLELRFRRIAQVLVAADPQLEFREAVLDHGHEAPEGLLGISDGRARQRLGRAQ